MPEVERLVLNQPLVILRDYHILKRLLRKDCIKRGLYAWEDSSIAGISNDAHQSRPEPVTSAHTQTSLTSTFCSSGSVCRMRRWQKRCTIRRCTVYFREQMFSKINALLREKGMMLRSGTVVDSALTQSSHRWGGGSVRNFV